MIALKPRHWFAAATLPTVYLLGSLAGPCPAQERLRPLDVDKDAYISTIDVSQAPNIVEFAPSAPPTHETLHTRTMSPSPSHWRWNDDAPRWRTALAKLQQLDEGDQLVILDSEKIATTRPIEALSVATFNRFTRTGENTWSFFPRETHARAQQLEMPMSSTWAIHQDTLYIAYYPEFTGRGCEVYAIDLTSGAPKWRAEVLGFARSSSPAQAQLAINNGSLIIFSKQGASATITTLDTTNGARVATQKIPAYLTLEPPREDMRSLPLAEHTLVAHDDHEYEVSTHSRQLGTKNLLLQRKVTGDVSWRFTMAGDSFKLFPMPADTDQLVVASYYNDRSSAFVTALDRTSGDILWSTRLAGTQRRGEEVDNFTLDTGVVSTADGLRLVVFASGDGEDFTEYIDPVKGDTLSVLY